MFKTGDIITWQGPERGRIYGDYPEIKYGDKFIVTNERMKPFIGYNYQIEQSTVLIGLDGRTSYVYDSEFYHCLVLETK